VKDFQGCVAVVTGGASGIGLATARRFAAEGMKLVLADVEADGLEEASAELEADGADVLAVPTDVARADAVDALARATLEHFGAVHIVFNNAGVAVTGSLWESRLEDLEWSLGVNLWGVVHGIRSFVPILLEQGVPGHVVNTASMAGVTTTPYLDAYTAAKHAVVALSECLHKELETEGSPVRASVLCPGLIKTRLMQSDRHRAEDRRLDPPSPEPSPGAALVDRFLTEGTDQGWDPSRVADAIVDGIREERFYIIPAQDELVALMDRRIEDLRRRRNPGSPES